ncbi:glycosyltransferase family 4 protein [Halobacterium salinarum]|uniref:glycosyltransferase family 4 protein n=1 Tax=Halobacterium salinarum TaxID=2242 RepID=UPI0030D18FF2
MSRNKLNGKCITFVIPHSPGAVGYSSGKKLLSIASYHDYYCSIADENGADVTLIYLDNKEPPNWDSSYNVETRSITRGSTFGSEFSLSLYQSLADTDSDIVHIHGYNQPNILPALASLSLSRSKVVVQNHGSALDHSKIKHQVWHRFLMRVFSYTVDKIISVNETEIKNLINTGACSDYLVHLPNGVDMNRFYPLDQSKCRQSLSLTPSHRYLLFVGKISPEKGVSYLLNALGELPDDIHLLLVYSGTKEQELAKVNRIIDQKGLENQVHFIGEVPQEKLAIYYNATDVCVFPSVNEGFGVVTLEAMACETPVIATTEHAAGGHLDSGENALIAETKSASSLAEKISKIFSSSDLQENIGRKGRKNVEKNYKWEQIGEKLTSVYEQIL